MTVMTMASEILAHGGDRGPGGWWPIFPLFWILLWGVVIFALIRARRGWGRPHHGHSAEDVLAERCARAEIDEKEYRERLNVLKGSR